MSKLFKTFLFLLVFLSCFPLAQARKQPQKKAEPVEATVPEKKVVVEEAKDTKGNGSEASPTATPEGALIDSLLEGGKFPEKSGFIATEEGKDKVAQVKESPAVLTPALPPQPLPEPEAPYGRLLIAMGVIILSLIGLALLWRKLEGAGSRLLIKSTAGGKLRILAQQPVGLKTKLLIIEAMGKRYLIGATQERVTLLADMDFFEPGMEDEKVEQTAANQKFQIKKEASVEAQASNLQTVSEGSAKVINTDLSKSAFVPLLSVDENEDALPSAEDEPRVKLAPATRIVDRVREHLKNLKKMSSTH